MLTALSRITKAGILSFWRNMAVSTATISVMTLTLFLITGIILLVFMGSELVHQVEQKIDVTVFFELDTAQEQIVKIQNSLEKRDDVIEAKYISRQQALENFRDLHKDDPVIQDSLEELGENPLRASLNIKAKKLTDFDAIIAFVEQDQYLPYISKIDSDKSRKPVERLSQITSSIRRGGIWLSIILVVVAIMVSFNTIRLTIYNARESIRIMRLVGSGRFFVRGPFVVIGILYGITSAIITLVVYFGILGLLADKINPYFAGLSDSLDIYSMYANNWWQFFLVQLLIGILLGGVSSFIAVRRYLKV